MWRPFAVESGFSSLRRLSLGCFSFLGMFVVPPNGSLALYANFSSVPSVIAFLRFIGILNASVWFGASLFFTFGIAPAFFTPEMKNLLGDIYAGLVAQSVLERYFILHYCCGAVAIMHQLAEWVYLGKALHRLTFGLLMAIMALSLMGGLWLQPKLKELNLTSYGMNQNYRPVSIPDAQRLEAYRSFRTLHGVSMIMNLVYLVGIGVYFWRVAHPTDNLRFVSAAGKFRG